MIPHTNPKNSSAFSDHITGNVDQTHLVVRFIHMFRTFVQIYDTARNILSFAVYFVQQALCLPLTLLPYNQLEPLV